MADLSRPLVPATYAVSDRFRAIDLMECVAFADDGMLVAPTGPRGDADSQAYARLFAAAPGLLASLRWVAGRIDDSLAFAGSGRRPVGADYFQGVLEELLFEVEATLKKAEEAPR